MAKSKTSQGGQVPTEVQETFELRPDLEKVYISDDGKRWAFDSEIAGQLMPDGYNTITRDEIALSADSQQD